MKTFFLNLLLFLFFSIIITPTTYAITPTAAIDIIYIHNSNNNNNGNEYYEYYTLLASQGNFAPYLPMNSPNNNNKYNNMIPMFPPTNDELLCSDISSFDPSSWKKTNNNNNNDNNKPFVFIVQRGSCTFQHKALIAQLYGASGIIIYGSLSSRYGYNETSSSVIYPLEYHDYDCSVVKGGGKSFIPIDKLIDVNGDDNDDNSKPYNSENNGLLSGSKANGNLCAIYSNDSNLFEQNCSSQKCVLTGNKTFIQSTDEGVSTKAMEACCAWDTHIFLYHDDSMIDNTTGQEYQPITIPAYYITMEEADHLLAIMQNGAVTVSMYTRWYPKYNVSTILIWALGVFVAALASYLSASEIRDARNDIEKKLNLTNSNNDSNSNSEESAISMRGGYQRVSGDSRDNRAVAPEEVLELDASHAIFFIIFSSAGLLILFFFKIYNVVKVFYAFGCSGAIMQVIVMPFYYNVAKRLGVRDRVVFSTQVAEIGSITLIDVISIVTAYGLGTVWIYMAFTIRHPDTIPFFWIMQDIMGACMCILFLQTMKLNSIKVASILLTAAFFYDIFFVFVTPYLTKGGKSIMVDVATSGGPPTGDPNWCEKYPEGPECQGGGKFILRCHLQQFTFFF